jgi:hypothetical protein
MEKESTVGGVTVQQCSRGGTQLLIPPNLRELSREATTKTFIIPL